jgi:hypothetical protein
MAGDSGDQWAQLVLEAVSKLANSPSTTWEQAATFASLPNPSTCTGSTWLVLTGTGLWPVSKPSGWYYSDGNSWSYLGAYNPIVTGGNVTVLNWPDLSTTGDGWIETIEDTGTQLLDVDPLRRGFIFNVEVGIIYIGLGFMPTASKYSYRLTNHSVVERNGFMGAVYALADNGTKPLCITELK